MSMPEIMPGQTLVFGGNFPSLVLVDDVKSPDTLTVAEVDVIEVAEQAPEPPVLGLVWHQLRRRGLTKASDASAGYRRRRALEVADELTEQAAAARRLGYHDIALKCLQRAAAWRSRAAGTSRVVSWELRSGGDS